MVILKGFSVPQFLNSTAFFTTHSSRLTVFLGQIYSGMTEGGCYGVHYSRLLFFKPPIVEFLRCY